jgi:hypothetical protein
MRILELDYMMIVKNWIPVLELDTRTAHDLYIPPPARMPCLKEYKD